MEDLSESDDSNSISDLKLLPDPEAEAEPLIENEDYNENEDTDSDSEDGIGDREALQIDIDESGSERLSQQRENGLDIKNIENGPFASSVYFVVELGTNLALRPSDRWRLEELSREAIREAEYLVLRFGLFDWEKDLVCIQEISEENLLVSSSFTPVLDFDNRQRFKVIVNYQIRVTQVGAEVGHVMIKNLPRKEQFLRLHLMIDLALLLQHRINCFMDELADSNSLEVMCANPVPNKKEKY
jgi:hypothetical protein